MKIFNRRIPQLIALILFASMFAPLLQMTPVAAQPVTATLQIHREDSSGGIVNFPAGQQICVDISYSIDAVGFNQCFTGIHPTPDSTLVVAYEVGIVYTVTITSDNTGCGALVVQPVVTVTDSLPVAYMELRTNCTVTPSPIVDARVQIHREDTSGRDVIFTAGEQICVGMNWTVAGTFQQCFPSIYSGSDGSAEFPYDSTVTYNAILNSNSTLCSAEVIGPTISGSGSDTVLYVVLRTTCPESYFGGEDATVQIHREDADSDEIVFPDGGTICLMIPFPGSAGFEQCYTGIFSTPDTVVPGIPYAADFDYTANITTNTSGCAATLAAPAINTDVTPPIIYYVLKTTCTAPIEPEPEVPVIPVPEVPVIPAPEVPVVPVPDPVDPAPVVPDPPAQPVASDTTSPGARSGAIVTGLPETGTGFVEPARSSAAELLLLAGLSAMTALWLGSRIRRQD